MRFEKIKYFQKLFLIFFLVFAWVFSGWPQIGNFPPKMEKAEAAAAFQAAGSWAGNATTASQAITAPACAANDILIATLINKELTVTISPPDGTWTQIYQADGNCTTAAYDHHAAIFWKKATESGGSFTFTKSADNNILFGGAITAWRGADVDSPLDATVVASQVNAAAADNVTFPAFDPTGTTSHILFTAFYGNDATTFGAAMSSDTNPDCTKRLDVETSTGNDASIAITAGDTTDGANITSRTWASASTVDAGSSAVIFGLKPAVAPTVTTQAADPVGETTTTGNGNITVTGGQPVTRRGFCYMTGTSGDPTTADSVAYDDGTFSTGTYTKGITGLSGGTSYRVRAYAINSIGTSYGTTVQILTKPAAPTSVSATDGTYTDKVTITWTKSTSATGYKVYEGSNLLDTLGDVATYDDTAAAAPTITAGASDASDGTSALHVSLSISGQSANNGTTRTYKVVAFNATGDSADSSTDTGYRGVGSLTYQWQRSAGDSNASYSNIDGATTASYDDTGTPADGSGRYYKCYLSATGATSQISDYNRGFRNVGTLSVLIVNGSGTEVSSPEVSFSNKFFDWSGQQSTGTLGFAVPTVEKIRVNNTTGIPGWTLSLSATSGASALWSDGSHIYDFNDTSSTGRLQVNPAAATITPQGGCSSTGLNKQSAAYFDSGNSVDIIITSGTEEANCYWDITGVGLTQDIPAVQDAGSYSINMTITIT